MAHDHMTCILKLVPTYCLYPAMPGYSMSNLKNEWTSVLTHFEIFITKICMKVLGIWHKKPWKTLEIRTKNYEKTWHLVFGKKWEPCLGNKGLSLHVADNWLCSVIYAPQILIDSEYNNTMIFESLIFDKCPNINDYQPSAVIISPSRVRADNSCWGLLIIDEGLLIH